MQSTDPSSLSFKMPDGSTLSLNKDLEITDGKTHALLEAGKLTNERDRIDIFLPLDHPPCSELKVFYSRKGAKNAEKLLALPQIEWVNIFIEPANTPLNVIPAEAGIQCLLAPGRWIPAKNLQE